MGPRKAKPRVGVEVQSYRRSPEVEAIPTVVVHGDSSAAIRSGLAWTPRASPVVVERRPTNPPESSATASKNVVWLIPVAALLTAAAIIVFGPTTPNAVAGLSVRQLTCFLVIAFLSGLMSGFSGFGFSAIGAASLLFLPPTLQVPLFQSLSTGNQLLSAGQLRDEMPKSLKGLWAAPGPCMLGGLLGAPLGIWLLAHLPPARLMATFGILLTVYAAYSYLKPPSLKLRGLSSPLAGIAVGLLGGMVGGFTAFPGAPVVVWIGLLGLSKRQHRAVLQPYLIMSQIYALALIALLHPSYLNSQYWHLLMLGLPAVVPGTLLGVAIYKRISDQSFKRVLYVPLGVAGIALLVKTLGPAIRRMLGLG
jgi:uncharacterized protein